MIDMKWIYNECGLETVSFICDVFMEGVNSYHWIVWGNYHILVEGCENTIEKAKERCITEMKLLIEEQ